MTGKQVTVLVLLYMASEIPGSCIIVDGDRAELWANERSGDCFKGYWADVGELRP